MTDTPLEIAVTRLARAIARLERCPPPPLSAAVMPAIDEEPDMLARLEERHARLRARVQDVIGQLDGLIATGETV